MASFEEVADSDISAQVPALISDAFNRLEEAAFVTGTGSGQPFGAHHPRYGRRLNRPGERGQRGQRILAAIQPAGPVPGLRPGRSPTGGSAPTPPRRPRFASTTTPDDGYPVKQGWWSVASWRGCRWGGLSPSTGSGSITCIGLARGGRCARSAAGGARVTPGKGPSLGRANIWPDYRFVDAVRLPSGAGGVRGRRGWAHGGVLQRGAGLPVGVVPAAP
jgi:hypothetical protein